MQIRTFSLLGMLSLTCIVGCGLIPKPKHREYFVNTQPQIWEDTPSYYVDPVDSSMVWSKGGVVVKIRHLDDKALNEQFDPKVNPYTFGDWIHPELGYTPPLWTVFHVTIINRTRERVELDPTSTTLEFDTGEVYYSRQGAGVWYSSEEFFDYSYVRWSGRDGNTAYFANFDRNDIWRRTEFLREKPIKKGGKYGGMLTFPPLPKDARSMTLRVDGFILAFDRFAVGYGNPTEFTDMSFTFSVDHGVQFVE